jgi:hypothetical protein
MVALAQSSLCYAEPAQENRRVFGRRRLHSTVEARRWDHSIAARRRPWLMLELYDLSLGGVSALSEVPLMAGEHISFHLPVESGLGTWEAFGRVIRCEPGGLGYRVAVEFDSLPAA